MAETLARTRVLDRFRWVDGHADVWRLFGDPATFASVVDEMVDFVREARATKVAGVEARGFILGGAVALRAGVGFVPIRKEAGLFPGAKVAARAEVDYRGLEHLLRLQHDALDPADRVALVDDWAELGSQAAAARRLIEECGASWAGVSLIVDQLSASRRSALAPVSHIVTADELGPAVM